MSYLALKHIHVSAAILSLSFFMLRGLFMIYWPQLLERRWIRRIADSIDSVLLLSALGLVVTLHQYPFVHHWLTAKIIALLLYIGFGSIALKRGRTQGIRVAALIAALASAAYILSVALTRSPYPW